MAHHHGLLNALSRLALAKCDGDDTEKVRIAACLAIELMSRRDEVRTLLSQNEGIMMALTKASYGEVQQKEFVDPRMSGITRFQMMSLWGVETMMTMHLCNREEFSWLLKILLKRCNELMFYG